MKTISSIGTKLFLLVSLLFLTCEFLIYFPGQLSCSWPKLKTGKQSSTIEPLHVIFLADTHLLGQRFGHWFDKLRREWQMQRSFQTAMSLFHPDAVFILGDIADEGKWEDEEQFLSTTTRFRRIFAVPDYTELYVVAGNHDIGFHDYVHRSRLFRFQKHFDLAAVKVISKNNIVFILMNSMAFHGDGCSMCSEAYKQLRQVSEQLNCTRHQSVTGRQDNTKDRNKCDRYEKLPSTKPIVLQHFPLYRESDTICEGPDAPPEAEKSIQHQVRKDVLSKEASDMQLSLLQPRMILSGHTHHACYVVHSQGRTPEISVPSFSWRNRNNPSFILATITEDDFLWEKCFLPEESTVKFLYVIGGAIVILWLVREIYQYCMFTKAKRTKYP